MSGRAHRSPDRRRAGPSSFSSCCCPGRDPYGGDGHAICLWRNPLPALSAAAFRHVRMLLRAGPAIAFRRIGARHRHQPDLFCRAAGDCRSTDATGSLPTPRPRLCRQRHIWRAHAGLVGLHCGCAAARLRGQTSAVWRRAVGAGGGKLADAPVGSGTHYLRHLICAINFISVVAQCGMGECHTFGYRLLPQILG